MPRRVREGSPAGVSVAKQPTENSIVKRNRPGLALRTEPVRDSPLRGTPRSTPPSICIFARLPGIRCSQALPILLHPREKLEEIIEHP